MPVFSEDNMVSVFRFKLYSVISDEYVVSKRFATALAIDRIGALRAGPPILVPHTDLNADEMTEIGYIPPRNPDDQTRPRTMS